MHLCIHAAKAARPASYAHAIAIMPPIITVVKVNLHGGADEECKRTRNASLHSIHKKHIHFALSPICIIFAK